MKACKYKWELEIVIKTKKVHLYVSKVWWLFHQTPLESDAYKLVIIKFGTHPPQGTITLTSSEIPHLHQKNRSGLWYPYSFGSMGVSSFPNPNKSIYKIRIINSIKVKFYKVALTSTMCTSVHMSIHSVMSVNVRSMCMSWFVCMHRWNLFLAKHGFQPCVFQSTLAQSGAQTIHILL